MRPGVGPVDADLPFAPSPPGDWQRRQRAVVHMGLKKTGSTTIHAWLKMNRDVLRQQGFWFDDLGPHGGPDLSTALGWSMFAQSVRKGWLGGVWERQVYRIATRADLERQIARFLMRAEATFPPAGGGTYVTSAEAIGSVLSTVPMLRRLHAWFVQRFEHVDYVVYLRDPLEWVPSAWVQSVRSGQTLTLDDYIEKHGRTDYHDTVARWQKVAGASSVTVRILDPSHLKNGDLVDDFAGAIGADPGPTQRPSRRNESMSPGRLNATLWVSRHFGPTLRRIGLGPVERHLYSMPLPRLSKPARLHLSPAQAARIRALNAESNEKLRALVFPAQTALFGGPMTTPPSFAKVAG